MKVFGIFSKTHQLNQRRPASAPTFLEFRRRWIFFLSFPLRAFRITTAVSTSLRKRGANFWELQLDSCAVMQKVGGGGGSKLVWKNERMDGRHEPDTPQKWFHEAQWVDLRGSENTARATLLLKWSLFANEMRASAKRKWLRATELHHDARCRHSEAKI